MSRRRKAAVASAALAAAMAWAAISALRSEWLREAVRARVVEELERASGGRVEISRFDFTWSPLAAEVTGLVVHGLEPASADPLFRARSVRVGLRVVSFVRKKIDLASLEIDQPRVNVVLRADGSTNIPEPKLPASAIDTILDLAVGRFAANNGSAAFAGEEAAFDVRGGDFSARFSFDPARKLYTGGLSARAMLIRSARFPAAPFDLNVRGIAAARGGVDIQAVEVSEGRSRAVLSGFRFDTGSREITSRLEANLAPGRIPKAPGVTVGAASIRADIRFSSLADYSVKGDAGVSGATIARGKLKATGVRGAASFDATPERIVLGAVSIRAQGGRFAGSGEVTGLREYRLNGALQGFPVSYEVWSGVVSGTLTAEGRIGGEPRRVAAKLQIAPGGAGTGVSGAIEAAYDGRGGGVTFADSFLAAGSSRAGFSGTAGARMRVRLESTNLDDVAPLVADLPVRLRSGSVLAEGLLTGNIESPSFSGRATVTSFEYSGLMFSRFSADAEMNESALVFRNAEAVRGECKARGEGRIALVRWRPELASAISAAGAYTGFDASEVVPELSASVSGVGRISGTYAAPRYSIEGSARNGSLAGETLDRLEARLEFVYPAVNVESARLYFGTSQIDVSGVYELAGPVTFKLSSNRMAVERFRAFTNLHEGVTGNLEVTASGRGVVPPDKRTLRLTDLTARASARDLRLSGKPLGNASLAAQSAGGSGNADLLVTLESDFLGASLRGSGKWTLAGNYPGSFQLSFGPLAFARVQPWIAPASAPRWDGAAEGSLRVDGPALEWKEWTGSLDVPRLEFGVQGSGAARIDLRNLRPVRLALAKSIVSVESALLAGPAVNLGVSGRVAPADANPLDLRVTGSSQLSTLQTYFREVTATGVAELQASVRGSFTDPRTSGRLEVRDAALTIADLPNGISRTNGVILFDENRATIQSLSGETGGGKVSFTGFVGFGAGDFVYRLQANGSQIRLRYPEGVSTTVNTALSLTGARNRSLLAGGITIVRTGFNPRTDFSGLLAKSAEPVKAASARVGPLDGMDLDVQIETSPDVSFESALARDVQVDAGLRLRGTVHNPALLGRIAITQGELNFFGTKYAINQGSITFSNPVKVEPVFDVDVETRVRGIDINLSLSGPIDKLNITHRSDPPLEFGEVVALLATGRAPTTDPALAAVQARRPQSFSQVGADAILGQALSSPVSERLQRFFGVSKLKIDPSLTGVENNPHARLTVEQQITKNLSFTYITNLARSNPQVVRVEWNLNREWSAVAVREENGLFGLDFLYKKRF